MKETGLNPAQDDAVRTISGPLLVLAGAGTGKTRVVTHRIANLIRHGTRPERILGVTFTKKAAGEMQERAAALLGGKKQDARPQLSTFHALCVNILRRHAVKLGYPAQFAIYDRGDQEGVARSVLREIRVDSAQLRPGDLLYMISRWKSGSVRPQAAASKAQTDKEHLAASAYRRYQLALKAAGAADFDDLLLLVDELFSDHSAERHAEARRFDHVLIDEYQDTNGTQYRIVKALATEHRNLCVVGDDDQSIYGWRGAEVAHILPFKDDWPEAKVVRLEDNYRSRADIVTLANRLIAFNSVRHPKVLKAFRHGGEPPQINLWQDEVAEAREVVGDIGKLIASGTVQPRDVAILFRTNEQPRLFETELRGARIPYVLIGGFSFFDRKEIRDLLAYLKVLAQPRDEVSLLRIINTPTRGIGQQSIERLLAAAVAAGKPIWEILETADQLGLTATAVAGIESFRKLIEKHRHEGPHRQPLIERVRRLIDDVGYRAEIERNYSEPLERQARMSSIEELMSALGNYERRANEPSLAGFLEHLALSTREDTEDKDDQLRRNAVVMLTLHSAEGLEFPHVYLVGLEEGLLPHHRSLGDSPSAIEEERRLCYVGITRARDRLTLSLALERTKWGKPRTAMPSRFLFELNGEAENPQLVAAREKAQRALRQEQRAGRPGSAAAPAAAGPGRRDSKPSTRGRAAAPGKRRPGGPPRSSGRR